ncbi:autotransporter outer membrane beta-barrel domain-containing protein [Ochrobactrum pseudogrignonense]|nr:autotransporter outer membrane beta-barrel domain-containing protein [Brucella pseudogrignonensis]
MNDFYRDGPSYDFTLGGFQSGIDLYRREQESGSRDLAGLFVGAGRAEANVDRVYGGNAGQLTMNGYSFGGYWTHLDQTGFIRMPSSRAPAMTGSKAVLPTRSPCAQQAGASFPRLKAAIVMGSAMAGRSNRKRN